MFLCLRFEYDLRSEPLGSMGDIVKSQREWHLPRGWRSNRCGGRRHSATSIAGLQCNPDQLLQSVISPEHMAIVDSDAFRGWVLVFRWHTLRMPRPIFLPIFRKTVAKVNVVERTQEGGPICSARNDPSPRQRSLS